MPVPVEIFRIKIMNELRIADKVSGYARDCIYGLYFSKMLEKWRYFSNILEKM